MPLLARRERGLEENPLPPVPRRLILVGQRELQFRLLFSTHQRLLYDQERPRHERSCAGRLPGCEACSSSPRARGSPTRLAPINHERRPYFGSVCFYERHRVSPAASSARSLSRRRRAQALLTLREVSSPPTRVLPQKLSIRLRTNYQLISTPPPALTLPPCHRWAQQTARHQLSRRMRTALLLRHLPLSLEPRTWLCWITVRTHERELAGPAADRTLRPQMTGKHQWSPCTEAGGAGVSCSGTVR